MKKLFIIGFLTLTSNLGFAETAKVVSVEPVYREVTVTERRTVEREICRDRVRETNGTAGSIIGGVVGGVAGHQVGGGDGKTAATILGAIVGANVGRRVEQNNARSPVCRVEVEEEVIPTVERRVIRYNVDVDVNGAIYTVSRQNEPHIGDYIAVNVSVN